MAKKKKKKKKHTINQNKGKEAVTEHIMELTPKLQKKNVKKSYKNRQQKLYFFL